MTKRGSVLVTGASGLVARTLVPRLAADGWRVFATTRDPALADADHPLLDLDAGDAAGEGLPPVDAVVVAAARARLTDCEAEPAATRRVNVTGTAAVAGRVVAAGGFALLLSSDKVFDGSRPQRRRDEPPDGPSVYGCQKADAEAAVRGLGPATAVLRLSRVLSAELGLVAGWAAALRGGRPVEAFADMYLAPVLPEQVAGLIARILAERAAGTWHLTGAEDRTYVDLARGLARGLGADPALVRPVAADPALFPPRNLSRHSTLDLRAEAARWGIRAPDFDATVASVAARL